VTCSLETDPVCGTCRRKSRKCDREKPQCRRCLSKGLVCEGYETRFKIYDVNSGSKRRKTDISQKCLEAWRPGSTSATDYDAGLQQPTTIEVAPQLPLATSGDVAKGLSPDDRTPSSTFSPLALSNLSSYGVPHSVYSPPQFEEDESLQIVRRQVLNKDDTATLLLHFKSSAADVIAILPGIEANPLRLYLLPLAYEHSGLLHALLAFSASHISPPEFPHQGTVAIEHKVLSIQALGSLLIKEQCLGLTKTEEDITLSIVVLLLLQDICESGISSHGAHLNGIVFLCARMVADGAAMSPLRRFLLAALSWFDLLRGLSGAEKLAFPPSVRNHVSESNTFELEAFTGCPKSIFELLGRVLTNGKSWLASESTTESFKAALDRAEATLRRWDPSHEIYPSVDPAWPLLADAYRHMALLRIVRFPDGFRLLDDKRIVMPSVRQILDSSAQLTWSSAFYKRMLVPLFFAGAESTTQYEIHYIQVSLEQMTPKTGFKQPALLQLLQRVWQERATSDGSRNVPWTEYVSQVTPL
jgi:hypothetical protein